jgi:PPOX class probable F420-dependent enzyme
MSLQMSEAERAEFLTGVHVGVLSVAAGDGRGPLTVPVWYSYQPGGLISLSTGRDTAKAAAIRAAGRVSFCVQDEAPPYKYVCVEGPAVIGDIDFEERLALARRYLGIEGGDQFMASETGGDQIAVRITPEHWRTADFGKS